MSDDLYTTLEDQLQAQNIQNAQKEISEQDASELETRIVNGSDAALVNNISGIRNTINKLSVKQYRNLSLPQNIHLGFKEFLA